MSKRRVTWDDADREVVVTAARKLQSDGRIRSKKEVLTYAQNALPADKRRPVNANTISWLSKELAKPSVAPPKSLPATPPRAVVADDEIPPPPTVGEVLARSLIEVGAELLTGILTSENVRSALRGLVAVALGQPVPPPDRLTPWPSNGHAQRRKVLIAGLIGPQIAEIEKHHPTALDVRFWEQGHSKDRLRALAKESEVSIGVVSFLSHSADATLKGNADKYIRHPGGMTALKDLLTRI